MDTSLIHVEYEPYLQIFIATYGECRGEGKTEQEARDNLEFDYLWSLSDSPWF